MLISLGTFGSKLLVFFMVRFYTSYLTPADYGTADLITQTANLLFPLISLGITDGVFRFAVDHTEQRRNIFSVGVYTILAGAVLLVAILPLLGLFPQFDGFLWLIALYTMCSCFHSLCAQFVRAEGHTALYAVPGHDQYRARHRTECTLPRRPAHGHHGLCALRRAGGSGVHAAFVCARAALASAHALPGLGGRARDAGLQHPHDPDDGVLVDHERVRPLHGHGLPRRGRQRYLRRVVQDADDPVARVEHFHGGVAVFRRVRGAGQPARAHPLLLEGLVLVPVGDVPRRRVHHRLRRAGDPRAHDRAVLRRVAVCAGARHGPWSFPRS